MAHDIFISYSNANQAWAESALQLLESQGFSCWMAPRDIRPGSTWAADIVHGISNARVMLLLLSSASNQSRQVAREVQLADSSQLRIVPVLLEAVKPEGDFVYFLSNMQWLTALGGTAADHSKTLLAAVGEALNASPPKPETAAPAAEPELHSSPSQPAAQNALPPRPASAIETSSFASPASSATPLTSRPIFWLLIGVAVVVVGAVLWFLGSSNKSEQETHQPTPAKQEPPARQEGPARPLPPSPALAGTWKGDVGAGNSVTIQIHLEPGEQLTVLVDNQALRTFRESANVLAANGGFIEIDMGQPPRARCRLRLTSDHRNLEGTWTQNKTSRTFNVVFTKVGQ